MEVDYKVIGEQVRRCRNRRRLTQEQLAELCEVSTQYISNIERAVSIPSTEVMLRLALALDTTPDELLLGAARQEGEDWRAAAEALRQLNSRQLKLVERFIRWTAEQDI